MPATTLDVKIARLQSWAQANYERGADTFVECWDRSDYERLLNDHGGSPRAALRTMKSVASVYRERQADADYYARGERDAA